MAEEERTPGMTSDDAAVLRVLLHAVKGLSPVATAAPEYVPTTEDDE